jgi:undecaprenyl diphosphate synthase
MANITLTKFTTEEQAIIRRLDQARLPRHIAVIMDGNGRWATRQGLPRVIGHRAGVESVRAMVNACGGLGVEYLTLYSFSTENWARPDDEVRALMGLIEEQLRTEVEALHRENSRVRHLGRQDNLPASLRQTLDEATALTERNTGLQIIFAINYSGRTELTYAARRLAAEVAAGTLDPAALEEADLARALYLPDVPAPDLLIRTGGEMRVSNYLLWQIAYAELWFTPLLWPEFRAMHLLDALIEYQHRQRKFGRVTS